MNQRFGGNHQGERSAGIHICMKPTVKDLVETAARDQFRSLSAQALKYVIDGLMRDGYIRPTPSADCDGK